MTTAEQVLLIILSAALAVFLILGIVSLILLVKLLADLRRITAKAEKLADQVEHVKDLFEKTAPVVAIGRLLGNMAKMYRHGKSSNHRNSNSGGEDE